MRRALTCVDATSRQASVEHFSARTSEGLQCLGATTEVVVGGAVRRALTCVDATTRPPARTASRQASVGHFSARTGKDPQCPGATTEVAVRGAMRRASICVDATPVRAGGRPAARLQ